MGRSWLVRSLVVLVIGVITAPGQPAVAAVTVCNLVPQLRAVTVNQGLESYKPLVRGKETLFRAFLSKPSCAGATDSIKLTGGQLKVSLGSTVLTTITAPTPVPVATFAEIASGASAPVADWPGDPIFVIPGSALAPASTTASFTATFTVTINFTATAGTSASKPGTSPVAFTTLTGSKTVLTSIVDKRSFALRVLVQPMGDPTKTFGSQFSTQAQSAIQDGMVTLSRIAPVPDGVGSLTGTTGGVRYTINSGILDVTSFLVSTSPTGSASSPPKFCGTAANFDSLNGVKAKLDQFLQAWNAANPTHTADRVLGVVDEAISLGGSFGCAEGMAAANGKQGWTRALYLTTPSMTGALTVMELLHTGGAVPPNRYDPYNPWHSPNAAADGTSPGRAYNVSQRAYLSVNKSVLNFTSNWNGTNTLAERDDYARWRCLLGGTTTTECTTSGVVGTAEGVGASPTLTATGNVTVDSIGNVLTVTDVSSYFTSGMARTPAVASPLLLVQRNGGTVLRSDPCPITFAITDHTDSATPAAPLPQDNTLVGSFFCAEPYNTSTTQIELVKDGDVVYRRATGAVPNITSTSATSESCRTPTITRFPVATLLNSPFKITSGPDGNLWFTEHAADKIGKITLAGEITEYAIPRWLATESMATGRYLNTATALKDGKVLVAGGYSAGNVALASAEIYDPADGTWTSTGSMAVARAEHTATLMGDAKVLVAGGVNGDGFLTSAEIYDPVTGTWSTTGSLAGSRYRHTATRLDGAASNTVLVAGGWNGGPAALASAERYSLTSGTWSAAASLSSGRVDHTATLLTNGTVLVAGGWTGTAALTSTEVYDPGVEGDSWTIGPSMAGARFQHVAVRLKNGKVLVAGGKNTGPALSSAEVYDGTTWSITGSMNTARAEYQGVVLGNSKTLVAGGFPGGASAELYDASTGIWTVTDSMGTVRGENTMTLIGFDKVLVAGGPGGTTALASAEIYAASLGPNGIASGPGGLWFTEDFGDRIGRITTDGVVTQFAIRPNSLAIGITAGPDGNLWFTEGAANRIGRITPAGDITEFLISDGSDHFPDNITSGPDGNLWFTEITAGAIGRITTDGVITEYSVAGGTGEPRGITLGPDGNLWFSDRALNKIGRITTSGTITEFPIPTAESQPLGITGGPDGQVWFGEYSASQIGSIATSGDNVVTEYADSDNIVAPLGITTGADNNLWFAQSGAVGRFAPCVGVGGAQATATVSFGDAPPLERRLDIFSCVADAPRPDVCYPIAVALSPDSSVGSSSTFTYHFNSSSCAGTTLRFLANNGIQQSPPSDTSSGSTCQTNPPVATIDLPLAEQTFLSYDVITLRGTATSQGSPLEGSALQFSTTIPGVTTIPAGAVHDLTPPIGGWAPGTYNVNLATAGSPTGTATTTITIKTDTAHVGRSDEFVNALTCNPAGVTTFQPFADWDGDGIDNISDSDVCTKATLYAALGISFPGTAPAKSPAPDWTVHSFTVPTSLTRFVVGLVVPYQTVQNVNGATVRIVKVAGKDVSANPLFTSPNNREWTVQQIPSDQYTVLQTQIPGLVSDKFGSVAFDAQKLAQYLLAEGLVNRSVTLEIEMQSQGTNPIWTALGTISVFVASK